MRKRTWKEYLFEGSLIVFSVLLALMISQISEQVKTNHEKITAKDNIIAELERNQAVIESWQEHHITIKERLKSVVAGENDSLFNQLRSAGFLRLDMITNNQSLVNINLSKTAWETSRSTGIINEFDFKTVQMLTSVYTLQEIVEGKTLQRVFDIYINRESHDLSQLNLTLIQLYLTMEELTGQETLLKSIYDKSIQELKQS